MPFNDDDGWLEKLSLPRPGRARPTRGCCCFGMHLNLVLLLNLFEGEGEKKRFSVALSAAAPLFFAVSTPAALNSSFWVLERRGELSNPEQGL